MIFATHNCCDEQNCEPLAQRAMHSGVYWQKQAERTFSSRIFLLPEPNGESALITALQSTPLSEMLGSPGKDYIGILYDQKLAGESSSRPQARKVPFWEERYTKLVKALLKARGDDEKLRKGDVFMVMDASKHGNEVHQADMEITSLRTDITPSELNHLMNDSETPSPN